MTEQEVFDKGITDMMAQGEPSAKDDGGCKYRLPMPDGTVRKCVAGMFIPDEVYQPEMDEGGSTDLSTIVYRFKDILPPLIKNHELLLSEMQGAHDRASALVGRAFLFDFLDGMKDIADERGLNLDVLAKARAQLKGCLT